MNVFLNICLHIVELAVDEFWAKHGDVLPKKTAVSVSRVEFLDRTLMIRMFFPKGKIRFTARIAEDNRLGTEKKGVNR